MKENQFICLLLDVGRLGCAPIEAKLCSVYLAKHSPTVVLSVLEGKVGTVVTECAK